jgi:hypothetical protein
MLKTPSERVSKSTKFMITCNPTTLAQRHMKKHGYNEDGTRIENKKRKANNIGDLITKQ